MLDLDLCLSASVNVRYILHTQPLRFIYNKILVWVYLYPSLSLSIFGGLSFLPPTPFAIIVGYPFTSPSSTLSISSTHTLLMAKHEICNANGYGDNNAIIPPSLQ